MTAKKAERQIEGGRERERKDGDRVQSREGEKCHF